MLQRPYIIYNLYFTDISYLGAIYIIKKKNSAPILGDREMLLIYVLYQIKYEIGNIMSNGGHCLLCILVNLIDSQSIN